MASVFGFIKRNYTMMNPPEVPKADKPIRFGILGAAFIAPVALINPAKSHPEVVIVAVAARDKTKAEKFAKKHGIKTVYSGKGGYDALLDDPEIDAIYNPLPNGLHYEWTMKALAKGKHVLLEKPSADIADETRRMFALAEEKGLVLLEAFHYRFHPAVIRARAILASGELGAIKSASGAFTMPEIGFVPKTDIRYNLALGGGAMMDMGGYPLSAIRFLAGENPTAVLSAHMESRPPAPERVDKTTHAVLALHGDATAEFTVSFGQPPRWGFIPRMVTNWVKVECEGGELAVTNFVMPTLYHKIAVKKHGGSARVEKVYKGEELGEVWWTTYRYQLEAFVNKLQGRTPHAWVAPEDSIANLEWIEKIYEKAGFGARPASTFTL